MIDLIDLVWFVFYAIVSAGVIGLLWFAIGYAEKVLGHARRH